MAESFIQLAPDSTGKQIRAFSSVVGANTVYEQAVVLASPRTRTGYYRADTGIQNVLISTAAHAATAGFWWLVNPVGSGVAVALKTLSIQFANSGATVAATIPRIQMERMTFTGTPTGTAPTAAKRVRTATAGLTADATNVASVRTASTGMTIAAGEVIRSWILPAVLSAIGSYGGQFLWDPGHEDDELILAAGEGIVVRQPDGGTATTEPRRITSTILWEEFTAP